MVKNIKIMSLIVLMSLGLFANNTLSAGTRTISMQTKLHPTLGHISGDFEIIDDENVVVKFFSWFRKSRLDKILASPILLSSAGLFQVIMGLANQCVVVPCIPGGFVCVSTIPFWGQVAIGTWCGYVFVSRVKDLPENTVDALRKTSLKSVVSVPYNFISKLFSKPVVTSQGTQTDLFDQTVAQPQEEQTADEQTVQTEEASVVTEEQLEEESVETEEPQEEGGEGTEEQ